MAESITPASAPGGAQSAPNLLSSILGHSQTITHLWQAADRNRLPHAMLFVGANGVGKRAVAWALAQRLACTDLKTSAQGYQTACGLCGSCLRVLKKSSESVLEIQPEKKQIRLEQGRRILDFLSLSMLGHARVIIIDAVESMNPQTSNSLLKVLEEPPQGTYFILLAPSSRHVLATIRSRSQVVQFGVLTTEQLRKKTQAPEWVLQASQGSLARVEELMHKTQSESRASAIQFLQQWLGGSKSFMVDEWRELIRDRMDAADLSRHMQIFFRDAILLQMQGPKTQLFNPDQITLLQQLAALPFARLQVASDRCLNLGRDLQANRDTTLLFEEFWLKTTE